MKFNISHLAVALLVVLINGCVNLKAVNDYAKSSKETIQAFNESDISLAKSYKHIALFSCMFDNLGNVQFLDSTCYDQESLKRYKKSDSLISVVNTVLEKYFLGLEELSNDESTSFALKSDNLVELLSDTTEFDISNDHIDAAKGLTEKLTNAALSIYKKKELANIISEAHSDLKSVLEMNKTILSDVRKNILNNKRTNENRYQNLFLNSKNVIDKVAATEQYIEGNDKWMAKIEIIDKYNVALDKIIQGHYELLERGSNLKTKNVIEHIAIYTTKIIEIRNEIKKLKDE